MYKNLALLLLLLAEEAIVVEDHKLFALGRYSHHRAIVHYPYRKHCAADRAWLPG